MEEAQLQAVAHGTNEWVNIQDVVRATFLELNRQLVYYGKRTTQVEESVRTALHENESRTSLLRQEIAKEEEIQRLRGGTKLSKEADARMLQLEENLDRMMAEKATVAEVAELRAEVKQGPTASSWEEYGRSVRSIRSNVEGLTERVRQTQRADADAIRAALETQRREVVQVREHVSKLSDTVRKRVTEEDVHRMMAKKADETMVTSMLDSKADRVRVDELLALKASREETTRSIRAKVARDEFVTALREKADKDTLITTIKKEMNVVQESIAELRAEMEKGLKRKAGLRDVNAMLSKVSTDMNHCVLGLDLKADREEVDKVVIRQVHEARKVLVGEVQSARQQARAVADLQEMVGQLQKSMTSKADDEATRQALRLKADAEDQHRLQASLEECIHVMTTRASRDEMKEALAHKMDRSEISPTGITEEQERILYARMEQQLAQSERVSSLDRLAKQLVDKSDVREVQLLTQRVDEWISKLGEEKEHDLEGKESMIARVDGVSSLVDGLHLEMESIGQTSDKALSLSMAAATTDEVRGALKEHNEEVQNWLRTKADVVDVEAVQTQITRAGQQFVDIAKEIAQDAASKISEVRADMTRLQSALDRAASQEIITGALRKKAEKTALDRLSEEVGELHALKSRMGALISDVNGVKGGLDRLGVDVSGKVARSDLVALDGKKVDVEVFFEEIHRLESEKADRGEPGCAIPPATQKKIRRKNAR